MGYKNNYKKTIIVIYPLPSTKLASRSTDKMILSPFRYFFGYLCQQRNLKNKITLLSLTFYCGRLGFAITFHVSYLLLYNKLPPNLIA